LRLPGTPSARERDFPHGKATRSSVVSQDEYLYLPTDAPQGRLLRIEPAD
jgi:hypothetical protein